MSFETSPKSYTTNLFVSKEVKKETMWNSIDPGDPYDIRKSTIARLPGAKSTFMGENIELVCLFQAAEIERLIQNLEEFRTKYKEVEKKDLDRHSFEIQIKQLAMKADQNDSLQGQNSKLKDFIKKQALQIEQLKRKASDLDANLQSKYHKALKQMEILVKDNTQLKSDFNGAKNQGLSWRSKFQSLERSSARELEELRMSLETRRKSQIDRQMRELQDRFQNERSQLEVQIRRLKQNLSGKNYETEELNSRISQMGQRLVQFKELEKRNREYEDKVVMATQQIERLNRVLRERNSDFTELQNITQQFEFELEGSKRKMAALESRGSQYESKMEQVSRQIERLNSIIEGKNRQNRELQATVSQHENLARQFNQMRQEFRKLTGENRDLSSQLRDGQERLRISTNQASKLAQELNEYKETISLNNRDSEEMKKKIQKLFQQNSFLSDENKMAQQNLRLSNAQQQKIVNELNEYRQRIQDNQAQNENVKRKIQNLIQQNSHLNEQVRNAQENLRLSANQIAKLNSEIVEYRNQLGSNAQQSQTYRRKIQNLISENTSLGDQIKTVQENLRLSANQVAKLNNEFKIVCNDNEELQRQLKVAGDINKKVTEYENRLALLSQEVERLNSVIENKNNEIRNLKNQIQEMSAMGITINSLQEKIQKLIGENKGLEGEVREAQENLRLSAQQNQKITKELNDHKDRILTNDQESGALRKKIQKLLQENTGLAEQVRNAQENVRLSNAQHSKAFQELTEYKRRIEQNDAENEATRRKIQGLTQQNMLLGQEVRTVQENLRLSANQISKLNNQILQFQGVMASNNQESETYKQKIQKLMAQNTYLGDQVKSAQENLRLSANTVAKLNNQLKITCNQLQESKRRVQQLSGTNKKTSAEMETKIALFSQEIERLNSIMEKKNQDLGNMASRIAQFEQSNVQESETYKARISKLLNQNTSLGDEVRTAQENLRLSAGTVTKLNNELKIVCNENEELQRKIKDLSVSTKKAADHESQIAVLSQQIQRLNGVVEKKTTEITNLNRKMHQIDIMNKSIGSLQDKISKLVNENTSMEDEMRNAQQNLRLSANQNQKMMREINEYKKKIEENNQENETLKTKINKLSAENTSLNKEFESAQESLRLSANQQAKLNKELNEYKSKIASNDQETETYRQKLKNLMAENTNLNDEVRTAQDNLRLSANQLEKLKKQLRVTCAENQELKRRLVQTGGNSKKANQLEQKVILLSAEVQRLRSLTSTNQSIHESSKQKLLDYETKLTRLTQEFEKLNKIIQELRRQNQILKQQNQEFQETIAKVSTQVTSEKIEILTAEIDRLTKLVEEKEEDLSELKLRFSDETSLVKRIQEHLSLFVVLFAEIQSLRKRVKDKEREVEDVRRSSLAPFRKIQ